jgi:hypothetical protein
MSAGVMWGKIMKRGDGETKEEKYERKRKKEER